MAKRKFLEVHHGTTRTVFLVGKYAIKIPLIKKYKGFIKGILANLTERDIWHLCPNYFLPVLWSSCTGLIVIMPRVKVISMDTWYMRAFMFDLFHEINDGKEEPMTARKYCEYNSDNIAMYKGKPICIDYGTYQHPRETMIDIEIDTEFLKAKLDYRLKEMDENYEPKDI